MSGKPFVFAACLAAVACAPAAARAEFSPWGALVNESWIVYDPADPKLPIHTANLGDYDLGFDQARSDDAARGMNALTFAFGGQEDGHLSTSSQAGSFEVRNTGGKSYTDILLLVAIDAAALPGDFSLSLALHGDAPTVLDPQTDFGYYDPAALGYDCGRPTGLYPSVTGPTGEPLAYSFDAGMVTIFGISGLQLGNATPSVKIDYAFENLPGPAVLSVYGLIEGAGWIYHTNRALVDNHDPSGPVSTFEVAPEPGTLVLLALAGLAGLRRRRRWRMPH